MGLINKDDNDVSYNFRFTFVIPNCMTEAQEIENDQDLLLALSLAFQVPDERKMSI